MNMITVTWFQALQVLGILVILVLTPTMLKIVREGEEDAREARRRNDEERQALLRDRN